MERVQAQIKTHPFFEAELALSMDTAGRETDDPQSGVKVVARHAGSSFLVHVPLKFVGQPICESTSLRRNVSVFCPRDLAGANLGSVHKFESFKREISYFFGRF